MEGGPMSENIYTTVGNWLNQAARERPDNEALIHHQRQDVIPTSPLWKRLKN